MVSLFNMISLLLITAHQASALNILGIFLYQGKSQFFQIKVYLQELTKRGHNVTVVSYFPNEKPMPNYHDISLGNKTFIFPSNMLTRRKFNTYIASGPNLMQHGINTCKKLVRNQKVRDLVKQKQKFDVVVAQQFHTDCALGIAYKLNAPVVGITSGTLIHYHCKRFGVPCNPAYVRSAFAIGGMTPTLYERIERNIIEFYYTIFFTIQQWVDDNTLAEYYNNIPPLEELARDIKILLVYQNFIITGPRILPFNVIEVGGYHVPDAKPLPDELKNFIEEAEHGVIYINFGTLVRFSEICNKTQEAIFEALQEFPQRVVFGYNGQVSHIHKAKMYSSDWLPQVDILAHPKTLLFISHGGLSSTMEALHYGVPMIIVPFFGDQYGNAATIEERGFGVQIDIVNRQSVASAIKKVLDPMFRAKALQLSKLFHDRPISPLDTAVYWTEFVARNANFTFRTPAADTPLYQYLYFDVAAVLIIMYLTIVYLTKNVGLLRISNCGRTPQTMALLTAALQIIFNGDTDDDAIAWLSFGQRLYDIASSLHNLVPLT